MAVTYGFYNALNHDRLYDAIQMSSIFDGIIQDGIFSTIGTSMIVTAPEDGMFVDVGPGRAWFNHTWTLNDTEYPVEAEEAEVVLDRIDAVILEVNAAAEVRANSIKFLKGTPSSNPVKPTLTHNAEVNQYALAYVTIRAGQTTIFQSDIENVIGTDETPFVTGLLQQLSIERLLLQWDDEFHRYFANFKTVSEADLNTWFNARKNEYDAWYADMEREGAEDLATFDAWFQHMKDQLDEDAAGHLQAEIDDLAEQCEKGSIVTVTTEESSLIGRSCTISQGPNSVVKTFDSNGVAEFPSIPYVGNDIDVRATNGDNIAQGTLTIPYFGRYGIEIDFWAATLDIHSTVEALYGRTLTISKGGSTVGTTTFDNTGHATFKVHETGTYHISTSTAGGDVYETDVTVTEETVYPISLGLPNGQTVTPVNDIQTWLKCAGITDKAYLTTLDDVLNEPATYETLLSDSNACDYMVRSTEWAGGGKVPAMTSDTTPSGECIGSSYHSAPYDYYKAFDGDSTTRWNGGNSLSEEYIGYKFATPTIINKVTISVYINNNTKLFKHGYVQGYDGTNWTNLSEISVANDSTAESTFTFANDVAYEGYRIYCDDSYSSNRYSFWSVQFCRDGITDDATAMATLGKYDYACEVLLGNATWASAICNSEYFESVLTDKVPVMTSATTPSGEVIEAYGEHSTRQPYMVFDGTSNGCGFATHTPITDCYIGYDFGTGVVIKRYTADISYAGVRWKSLQLKGSNNKLDWDTLDTYTLTTDNNKIKNISNNTAYRFYALFLLNDGSFGSGGDIIKEAQFYGRHEAQTGIIHSAANDTIYYISAGQQVPVCVTDANGVGHFDLDDLPKGSLTLYSTVAKDPDNLSNNYSKQFTITSNTTELWLMPDGALYWYGYISSIAGGFNTDYTQNGGYKATVDYNTNSMTIHPASGYFQSVSTNNSIPTSGKTIKAKIIWPAYQSSLDSLYAIGVGNVTNWNASTFDGSTRTSYNHTSGLMVVNCTANGYVRIISTTGFGDGTLDFLLYE